MTTGGHSGRRGAGTYDQALKILGERWAPQLAALLYPGAQLEEPLSGELPASERRVDWLWRAQAHGAPCVLHVEFQLRGKPDMARRMFIYGSRILAQYELPPLAVLVYLIPARFLAESPYLAGLPGREVIRYTFEVVRLWEVDPEPILSGKLSGLVPLVPLMRGAAPEQLPELAEHVIQLPDLDALQRGDLVGMLATFGALRFPKVDIWDLLRRNLMLSEVMSELMEDSPFLRRIHDDALAEGRQEGRQEGREQGREEGVLLGARVLAREVVLARFPELDPADLEVIDRIDSVERLRVLARTLASAEDMQAVHRALVETGQ
ncbi:MAG: hypothetical protein PVSMB4_17570 [Ktedonobacterales bacterium]